MSIQTVPMNGTPNISKSMVQAYKNMGPITKNKKNTQFNYAYADLDTVLATIHSALREVGLYMFQECKTMKEFVEVETFIEHESGEIRSYGVIQMPVFLGGKMSSIHAYASALTYAKRYALCGIFALSADTDDDGNSAVNKQEEEEKPSKKVDKAKLVHDATVTLAMEVMATLKLDQTEFGKMKEWLLYWQSQRDKPIRESVMANLAKPEEFLKSFETWKAKNGSQEPKVIEMNG